jgi:hypothetical protein
MEIGGTGPCILTLKNRWKWVVGFTLRRGIIAKQRKIKEYLRRKILCIKQCHPGFNPRLQSEKPLSSLLAVRRNFIAS